MKTKSFLKKMDVYRRWQLILVTFLVLGFTGFTILSAREKQRTELSNYLSVFSVQMENRITRVMESLSEAVYDNPDLELLGSTDDAVRQRAAVQVLDSIRNIMRTVRGADLIAAASRENDLCIDEREAHLSMAEQLALRQFAHEYAHSAKPPEGWQLLRTERTAWLYRGLRNQRRAVLGFLSTRTLLDAVPAELRDNQCFLLADGGGTVLDGVGRGAEALLGASLSGGLPGLTVQAAPLAGGALTLVIAQGRAELLRQVGGALLLLLLLIALLWAFSLRFSLLIRRELLRPMEEMTRDMARIRDDGFDRGLETRSDSVEFQTLVSAFNTLIREILRLKIRGYERQLAFLDAEQKYLRLQLRPHFFLNAMTTIVSLSRGGQNAAIETYIGALSKNIRYMFSAGVHTVALGEELRHVENYFAMQELRYPDAVLYFIDIPDAARPWQIPQMLIHTVIENEYKYAVNAVDQLLVLIRARLAGSGEEAELVLEIEDNGRGYPDDALAQLNTPGTPQPEGGSRVGLWSVRRLLELLYGRSDLMELSNVEPHGALTRFRIPRQTVSRAEDSTERLGASA